jgi:hypothetical protein
LGNAVNVTRPASFQAAARAYNQISLTWSKFPDIRYIEEPPAESIRRWRQPPGRILPGQIRRFSRELRIHTRSVRTVW